MSLFTLAHWIRKRRSFKEERKREEKRDLSFLRGETETLQRDQHCFWLVLHLPEGIVQINFFWKLDYISKQFWEVGVDEKAKTRPDHMKIELVSGRKGWSLDSNSDEAPLPKKYHCSSLPSPKQYFFFFFLHVVGAQRWRRKWQPTPMFLPGESQGRGSLVGCRLWGRAESDTTEAT